MTVDRRLREEPKTLLQDREVHAGWISDFRGRENAPFYNLAFDFIARRFGPPGSQPVLDAGCGSGTKSIRLARRSYRVLGLDISKTMLDDARAASSQAGTSALTEFCQADLTRIPLKTGSISNVVCWGVLMHVPQIERAVAELSRVLSPGGILVISEGNRRSLQAVGMRAAKRMVGRRRAVQVATAAGLEFWEETSTGRLLTRQADIPWLVREFERHGLRLETRRAGQFTELYTRVPWMPVRWLIHRFNNIWFSALRSGRPAFGNLLVFRRPESA
jgi:ubiquinone/menaquinone biosynthesis C-methylase UbiE